MFLNYLRNCTFVNYVRITRINTYIAGIAGTLHPKITNN